MSARLVLALLALSCAGSFSQQPPQSKQPRPPQGQPGLPPGPRPPGSGPWDNDVVVTRIGADGRGERLSVFERAGVPTVARLKDGRLLAAFQNFPSDDNRNFDRVAVRFSSDEGKSWTPAQPISVTGMNADLARPFDPTLVPLPDGRVRLYFTSNRSRDFRLSTPEIYSAISSDGVNYTFEPGVRFAIEGRVVIDCAAALHNGLFHLIVPDNGTPEEMAAQMQRGAPPRGGSGYHATSKDGLTFQRVADVTMPSQGKWLGNMQSEGGQLVFFGSGPGPWPLVSSDGATWRAGTGAFRFEGADPGAVKLRDGSWLVVATSFGRANAVASATGKQPQGNPPGGFAPRPTDLPQPKRGPFQPRGEFRMEEVASKYPVAADAKKGRFTTGQPADIVLGAKGFNNSGGPLLFNHPTGLATDGKSLMVADRWNNRVLVWKSAPAKNTPPDFVLGQPDFTSNDPGTGRHQMNWPGNVAMSPDGTRLAVADTDNDRVLIWNSFPTKNAQPADLVIDLAQLAGTSQPRPIGSQPGKRPGFSGGQRFGWPWGVWTDGTKLAVVATRGSAVLVWNALPTRDHQSPDLVLRPQGAGTPRNITSDGKTVFAVSDHNYGEDSRPATMVWRGFPTSADQPADFTWREWMKGSFAPDRELVLAGMSKLFIWNSTPRSDEVDADVILRPASYRNGDGPDAVIANGRLYVANYNGNNVLAWNALPTRDHQPPDFAIGSDTPEQDTWAENFFITNPVVATDGTSLFVTSDFDRKMFVWRRIPDASGAKPDLVVHLPEGPWDNALHGQTLVLAGRNTVYVWKNLPLKGEPPDVTLSGNIGGVQFGELTGVALDAKHLYLADRRAGRIYVWEGIPVTDSEPKCELPVQSAGRLSSDGTWLAAAPFEGSNINLWRVSELANGAQPQRLGGPGRFNLPGKCVIAHGHMFVADTSFHRVHVWHRVEDALDGRPADALFGAKDDSERKPSIGRDTLFQPATLAFDGARLWVGEFKFSTRVLRFTAK
jgi:DNA-binding beta-propeller fold protein YncE